MKTLWAASVIAVTALVWSQSAGNPTLAAQQPKGGTVIQLDLSKLPPDLAQRLLEFALSSSKDTPKKDMKEAKKAKETKKEKERAKASPKGATGAISMADAVGIAEKAVKGQTVRAERKDGLDYTHFKIEVVGQDGTKTRFTIGGTGTILEQKKGGKDRN